MATPKTQKNQKNCARRAYERATLKAKHTAVRIYAFFFVFLLSLSLLFFFGSSEIFDAGVRFFLLLLLFDQGFKR